MIIAPWSKNRSSLILDSTDKKELAKDLGWAIFEAFNRHCKVSTGGFTSLDSILASPPTKRDKMESFFLAETLKYLFLVFES